MNRASRVGLPLFFAQAYGEDMADQKITLGTTLD